MLTLRSLIAVTLAAAFSLASSRFVATDLARDDLVEQALQLIVGGRARLLEDRLALGAPIHAIEHQTVQMDVQVGGRAESLDERDRSGVGCGAFQACLLEQKARDDPVDDAQHRREQLGVRRKHNTQRDRK